MGRFRFESNRMKVLIAGLLCATVALALPEGRRLRAEEHWRPAQGRDLSKYKPRHAMVPASKEDLSWAIKEVKKNGASTKKGTNIDLKATLVLKDPPLLKELSEDTKPRSTSGPGRWLSSLTMLGSVAVPSSMRTMSSPLLTVLMELLTLTSWLELTMLELLLSPTVSKSPPTMGGLTHSGMTTPLPMILPSLNCHHQLTSTTTLLHLACLWAETLLMRENS